MARTERNLPIDYKWKDAMALAPNTDKPHVFVDGEYIETPYVPQQYPKTMYHADYVPNPKAGEALGFTQQAQVVNNEEEEIALGEDWSNSPAKLGIVTAPDAEQSAKARKRLAAQGANWRGALGQAGELTESHVEFLQAMGAQVTNLAEAYAFCAGLTSQQMKSFLSEASAWEKQQNKGKKTAKAS